FLAHFRPLMRAEVFDTFSYLLCGLLIGEAKHGTVRSAVFAPADYQPQRLSDLFCRHKLSRQALMAQLTRLVLTTLYPAGLPALSTANLRELLRAVLPVTHLTPEAATEAVVKRLVQRTRATGSRLREKKTRIDTSSGSIHSQFKGHVPPIE
ncbi:MAG: hypothetical protein M3R15_06350, partial [Acidobacteriota bacterium]|nr:hypothetical protein [Acidobacteriota bacterium]